MSAKKQLKFGTMTLEFSKPFLKRNNAKSFVGILKSTENAVSTVRQLRDMDSNRESIRLND